MSLKAGLSSTVDNSSGSGSGGVSRISPLRLAVVVVVAIRLSELDQAASHMFTSHLCAQGPVNLSILILK